MGNIAALFICMPTITFTQVNAPTDIRIRASEGGRLLVFKGAILALAEINKNLDLISEKNIDELAATIGGMPIDVEHDPARNCGIFTKGEAVTVDGKKALSVDGMMWASRYPNESAGVQDGTQELSVEASAEEATCSVCGGVFDESDSYCDHLRSRSSGAARGFIQMCAEGGAITERPAGSATRFDSTQVYMVASHQVAEKEKTPSSTKTQPAGSNNQKLQGDDMDIKELEAKLKAAQEELATLKASADQLGAAKAALDEQVKALQAQVDEAKANAEKDKAVSVEAAKAVATLTASVADLTAKLRRQALADTYSDEEWEKDKATVLAMDEPAFVLFASKAKPAAKEAVGLNIQNSNGKAVGKVTLS